MKAYTITITKTIYKDNDFNAELTGNNLAKQINGELIHIENDTTTIKQGVRKTNAF